MGDGAKWCVMEGLGLRWLSMVCEGGGIVRVKLGGGVRKSVWNVGKWPDGCNYTCSVALCEFLGQRVDPVSVVDGPPTPPTWSVWQSLVPLVF